jgi:hypothetical protein
LNFYLPHECGGFGEPFYEKHLYDNFNIYSDKMDLAIIKPKYTTKNEFKVDLPKNEYLDELDEENEGEQAIDGGATQQPAPSLALRNRVSVSTK